MANPSPLKHPKTHSDILWHFTGGPLWNKKQKKQSEKPKSIAKSFDTFIKILKSRELRIGSYHEIIKATTPPFDLIHYELQENPTIILRSVIRGISTAR